MSIPLKLSVLLLCVPMTAGAFDGMNPAAGYECRADAVNQDRVDTCIARFPALTSRAHEAMAGWRGRNAVKAKMAQDACEAENKTLSTPPSAAELAQTRQLWDELLAEINTAFQDRVQREGPGACIATLEQLGRDGGTMDFR